MSSIAVTGHLSSFKGALNFAIDSISTKDIFKIKMSFIFILFLIFPSSLHAQLTGAWGGHYSLQFESEPALITTPIDWRILIIENKLFIITDAAPFFQNFTEYLLSGQKILRYRDQQVIGEFSETELHIEDQINIDEKYILNLKLIGDELHFNTETRYQLGSYYEKAILQRSSIPSTQAAVEWLWPYAAGWSGSAKDESQDSNDCRVHALKQADWIYILQDCFGLTPLIANINSNGEIFYKSQAIGSFNKSVIQLDYWKQIAEPYQLKASFLLRTNQSLDVSFFYIDAKDPSENASLVGNLPALY